MTVYERIMQDAQPTKPYKLTKMDYYVAYCICSDVRKCVIAAIKGAEKSKISYETINLLAFCNSLIRKFHEGAFDSASEIVKENIVFNEYEIKMMLTIMEGCYCCGDRLRCPYSAVYFKGGLSKEANRRTLRTLNKLRKYKEEIDEHNSNEMSNLGS